jgi:hypothetical protein
MSKMIFDEKEMFDQMAGNFSIMKQCVRDLNQMADAPESGSDPATMLNWFQLQAARAAVLSVAAANYVAAINAWVDTFKKPEWPEDMTEH